MNAAVALREEQHLPAAPNGAMTPMDMLNHAVSNGSSVEVMAKLLELQERWESNQAKKAFDAAVSAAKGAIPPIVRDRQVGFESRRTGENTSYRHESLGEIARVVDPILNKHGLSYRFRAAQEQGRVSVTCVLSHRDGYSEDTTLSAGADDSGKKNSIQAIGSTTTYLQRYTLKLALGLATTEKDDDGAASEDQAPSAAAQAALDAIVACETLEDCTAWHAKNAEGLSSLLTDAENNAVVRAFNDRRKAIRGALS